MSENSLYNDPIYKNVYALLYWKFFGPHYDFDTSYGISVSQMTTDMSQSQSQLVDTNLI